MERIQWRPIQMRAFHSNENGLFCTHPLYGWVKNMAYIYISVQAEKTKIANPTFLVDFDLNFHMPGHFLL